MGTARRPTPMVIRLAPEERARLERWARGRRTPARLVRRARIILRAAEGMSNAAIARALRTDRECVGRWRARFAEHRLAGIQHEASRPGRPPVINDATLQSIVTRATTTRPRGAAWWSTRRLARAVGVSPATVHRVWKANGVSPHWVGPFGLRPASQVLAHLTEVIGGYLTQLDSAVVVCGDATWPLRPTHPSPGERRRRRRGGSREPSGPPARYADLDLPTGTVIGSSPELTRHRDWLRFLDDLAVRVPRDRWVHVVADNTATHQHPEVQRWVRRHRRIQLHLVAPQRPVPRWLAEALQRWVDATLPVPDRRRVQTLRETAEALRPRRQRGNQVVAWTDSRYAIGLVAGNPRWRVPPPGMRVKQGRLVPCPSDVARERDRRRRG